MVLASGSNGARQGAPAATHPRLITTGLCGEAMLDVEIGPVGCQDEDGNSGGPASFSRNRLQRGTWGMRAMTLTVMLTSLSSAPAPVKRSKGPMEGGREGGWMMDDGAGRTRSGG